jgi:hypothetical protein
MAMNPDDDGTRRPGTERATTADPRYDLPCGRSVEDVWEELEAGTTSEHTAGCPHCSTARTSLDQLAEATRELVEDPIEAPPGLFDRILGAVRADLAVGDALALPTPAGGADVSTTALAAVLRYAVDSVAGVRAHRCRVEPDAAVPHAVRVWMSVSLDYRSGRVEALDVARDRIRTALSQRIGLQLSGLDLELTDLWLDGPAAPSTDGSDR